MRIPSQTGRGIALLRVMREFIEAGVSGSLAVVGRPIVMESDHGVKAWRRVARRETRSNQSSRFEVTMNVLSRNVARGWSARPVKVPTPIREGSENSVRLPVALRVRPERAQLQRHARAA